MIEPDLSNAVPFLAAAVVSGGTVRIAGWPTASLQPADTILAILEKLAIRLSGTADSYLEVQGAAGLRRLRRRPARRRRAGARGRGAGRAGRTRLGVAAARHRPSARPRDRPAGRAERRDQRPRRAMRGDRRRSGDHRDGRCTAGMWRSYADHRMATAGAIVGLRVPGVEVEDIGTTAKTLPEFPQMWADMLAGQASAVT